MILDIFSLNNLLFNLLLTLTHILAFEVWGWLGYFFFFLQKRKKGKNILSLLQKIPDCKMEITPEQALYQSKRITYNKVSTKYCEVWPNIWGDSRALHVKYLLPLFLCKYSNAGQSALWRIAPCSIHKINQFVTCQHDKGPHGAVQTWGCPKD